MPNYEYRCEQGHRFDRLTSFDKFDKQLDCPTCGRTSYRQFAPTKSEVVYLGTGWAKKDRENASYSA